MHPPTTFPQFPVNWTNVIILQAGLWLICVGGIWLVFGHCDMSKFATTRHYRQAVVLSGLVFLWGFALGNAAIMLACFPRGTTHIVRTDLFWAGNDIPFVAVAVYIRWKFGRRLKKYQGK